MFKSEADRSSTLLSEGLLKAVQVLPSVAYCHVPFELSTLVTAIVALPDALNAGVSVREASLPPRIRFVVVLGTNVVLLEVAVTVRLAVAVAASPTVKLNAPVS